jgi:hypothetical protein
MNKKPKPFFNARCASVSAFLPQTSLSAQQVKLASKRRKKKRATSPNAVSAEMGAPPDDCAAPLEIEPMGHHRRRRVVVVVVVVAAGVGPVLPCMLRRGAFGACCIGTGHYLTLGQQSSGRFSSACCVGSVLRSVSATPCRRIRFGRRCRCQQQQSAQTSTRFCPMQCMARQLTSANNGPSDSMTIHSPWLRRTE